MSWAGPMPVHLRRIPLCSDIFTCSASSDVFTDNVCVAVFITGDAGHFW